MLALTVRDIDFSHKIIHVHNSLFFKENEAALKCPKTKAGLRSIPIPEALLQSLKKYCEKHNSFIIFEMSSGNYMTRSSFTKFWKRIIKKVNMAADKIRNKTEALHISEQEIGFTPHMFRHTYATNLYYAGVDIKTAQYYLGHASLSVTLEIYTHLQKERIEASEVKKINNYLEKFIAV